MAQESMEIEARKIAPKIILSPNSWLVKQGLCLSLVRLTGVLSDLEYFYSPLDGMLVHRRVTPSSKFAGAHLYTWVERGTMRVKCFAQEHKCAKHYPRVSFV